MIITTRRYVVCKNHVARSNLSAFISSGIVGLDNYLAQMIFKTRQCVLCMNHVATSKVKFTVRTYSLCIGLNETYSCRAHNFVVAPAPGMGSYGPGFSSICTIPSGLYLTLGTRWGHQCPLDTFLFLPYLGIRFFPPFQNNSKI